MKRVFLDANVLFTAAHNPAGKASLLFELARRGHWTLITCQLAYEEARRNVRIKFPTCQPRLNELGRGHPNSHPSSPNTLPPRPTGQGSTHIPLGSPERSNAPADRRHQTFRALHGTSIGNPSVLIQTVSNFLLAIFEK